MYDELEKLEEVYYLDAATGSYDIIALLKYSDFNALANFVLNGIQQIDGATDTTICNCIFLEN